MAAAKVGDRVELIGFDGGDPYTNLKRGDRGTVELIDDGGTVHVNWDRGSRLGLVKTDRYKVVSDG